MSDEIIKKEDLFDVIRHGTIWYGDKIKEGLEKVVAKNTYPFIYSEIRRDSDDKYYYLYDNECYLLIWDQEIEVRCDRSNVFSSGKNIKYPIKTIEDIELAYDLFASMTMEDEEDE